MTEKLTIAQQAIKALVLTRDYVGHEKLPTIKGWEWFDACNRAARLEPDGVWTREFLHRTLTCPLCGDKSMVFPREGTPFCEDGCNWPDHNTSSITREELLELIKEERWSEVELANVSQIDDMSCLFADTRFNGDISMWDVSNVEDMSFMFFGSQFNGDISMWDVSNVRIMYAMFQESKFNNNISQWDVSSVENMSDMFRSSIFNKSIELWKIKPRTAICGIFYNSRFDGELSHWDVDISDMRRNTDEDE